MKIVLELTTEETLDVDSIKHLADRIATVTSGYGPQVYPRMLIELQPTYLEIPFGSVSKTKSRGMASPSEPVR